MGANQCLFQIESFGTYRGDQDDVPDDFDGQCDVVDSDFDDMTNLPNDYHYFRKDRKLSGLSTMCLSRISQLSSNGSLGYKTILKRDGQIVAAFKRLKFVNNNTIYGY